MLPHYFTETKMLHLNREEDIHESLLRIEKLLELLLAEKEKKCQE